MTWDLDMIAALICGLTAMTLFALHVITAKRFQAWVTLPEHLRIGLLLAGGLFMLRSVNLLTLPTLESRGHANAEGVLTAGVLLYLLVSTTVWVAQELHAKRQRAPQAQAFSPERVPARPRRD